MVNCETISKILFILNYHQQINKRVLSITLWKRIKYANNYITGTYMNRLAIYFRSQLMCNFYDNAFYS